MKRFSRDKDKLFEFIDKHEEIIINSHYCRMDDNKCLLTNLRPLTTKGPLILKIDITDLNIIKLYYTYDNNYLLATAMDYSIIETTILKWRFNNSTLEIHCKNGLFHYIYFPENYKRQLRTEKLECL